VKWSCTNQFRFSLTPSQQTRMEVEHSASLLFIRIPRHTHQGKRTDNVWEFRLMATWWTCMEGPTDWVDAEVWPHSSMLQGQDTYGRSYKKMLQGKDTFGTSWEKMLLGQDTYNRSYKKMLLGHLGQDLYSRSYQKMLQGHLGQDTYSRSYKKMLQGQ